MLTWVSTRAAPSRPCSVLVGPSSRGRVVVDGLVEPIVGC